MAYLLIPLSQLTPDPNNIRAQTTSIDELCQSIQEYGLLQNLVVEPLGDDKYMVKAGNRRYRALSKLESEGLWSEPVPCLIEENSLAQIIENLHREDVPIWRMGRRYIEISEQGFTLGDVARQICKSQAHVSLAVKVAERMHPKIQAELERIGHNSITKSQAIEIAKIVDREGNPDYALQAKVLERFLENRTGRTRAAPRSHNRISQRSLIVQRVKEIANQEIYIPPQHVKTVAEVIDYILGHTATLWRHSAKRTTSSTDKE